MDADAALAAVSTAVVAAFPDRAAAFLDAIERAFRLTRDASPRGWPCVFCGHGQFLRYPLPPEDPLSTKPTVSDRKTLWSEAQSRLSMVVPPRLACLDCMVVALEEHSANPPSARVDRILLDSLRAVRESGLADVVPFVEDAFARGRAPRIASGQHRCDVCERTATCARGAVGGAICADCARANVEHYCVDRLTGVETRTVFGVRLHLAIERAQRLSTPLSLLMIDVDWMKMFNDIHGHIAGDALLTRIPAVVRPLMTGGDGLSRIGGEEFAILLPARTSAEAVTIAEEIRVRALASLRPPGLDVGGPRGDHMSVSVGVASLRDGESSVDVVREADLRVQDAKNAGRNRVCA